MKTLALLAALTLAACSGSTPDDTAPTGSDPAAACTDLCTSSGFDAGTADVYEHEVNCTCSGGDGSGTISAEACTETCTGLGWSAGQAYAADACQCS